MTRFRAAGIHLIVSIIIVLSLLALMFLVWYPDKYFKLMGGSGLIYLIAGIDICLGPLLTLLVFKSSKHSLKFDLMVIALLQVAALTYGSYIMFNSRPIFTAYSDGEFSVATAGEVNDDELKLARRSEWTTRSLSGPVIVGITKPALKKDLMEINFLAAGMGYARFPKLFVPYESQRKDVLRAAKPLGLLKNLNPDNRMAVEYFLKNKNRSEKDFVFVPISSFFCTMAAIVDAKTAAFVTIIDAKPRRQ